MSLYTLEPRLWDGFLQVVVRAARFLFGPAAPAIAIRHRAEMVSLVFSVCIAVFLTKGFIAFRDLDNPAALPQICDDSLLASLARLWACCAEDFAVGLGCLLVGTVALRLSPGDGVRHAVRLLAHLAAAAAVVYMVISAQLFHVVRHYLTYSLFRLGGGLQLDRSITAYISLPLKLALALVPLATLAAHLWAVHTFPRFWHAVADRAARPVLLLPLLAGLVAAGRAAEPGLLAGCSSDFPRSPHLLFARSLFWGDNVLHADDPEADIADFLPGQSGHTPGLLGQPPRNIILITLESVSSTYFETYGYALPTTPNLRRLQDRSLTFDNFYATANHSIASALPILAGIYNDPTTLATVIDYPNYPTPHAAGWLQRLGYRTYFLASGGKWAWEDYRNMVPAFCEQGYDVARDPAVPFWRGSAKPGAPLDNSYLDADLFADVRRAVREERGGRFALFVWAYETHAPYYEGPGPQAWDETHFPAAVRGHKEKEKEFRNYLRALWRIDQFVGELYQELEDLGLADDTLIVLTGDHGEAFGEHGFFGHGWSVYEEEVRTPLILICPRLRPLGQRSAVLGSHVDLWATITDICALPFDPRWQGRSLVSGHATGRRAYFYRQDSAIGVREGRYKYVWDFRKERPLLFDLESDPGERHNLASQQPERCATLHRRVQSWTTFQKRLTADRLREAAP